MFATTSVWGTNWMIDIHFSPETGEPNITIMDICHGEKGEQCVGEIRYSGTIDKLAKDLKLEG